MATQNLTMEMGKLMATVVSLQNQLTDIKKQVCALTKQLSALHDEIREFIGSAQTKIVCEHIHERLKKEYVARSELAPFKTILGAISVTTVTAICVALLNLILK